ncbi:MBOAT, membrane-bound O-acyltransferase family-domain-containing protein [Lasiosphaeria miniovina]|uniref:MBOAT, membrane-bound O-acyltransferase family-domain-containing protein n=1 Tax=Lasiosphaeria miniovina TaxID=1954250 RepID=A0AA40E2B0_9PEZI|nr:MBOAT, membrane-bound O-acyltransferase family-domain-containing protein [Lasiosphaeria miniovina]KAK0722362.1 MBOAT, membrane-bound O-acyltransferase family-domain-containing protein [Lasiosphaeria miniovina]
MNLLFSFLLSYPLAGVLKRVPDARPEQKNLFILSVSIFYLVGLFDLWDGLRTILISSLGSYAIAKFLRGSPYMPWVGFVFLMCHMSVNHIARQAANDPHSVDITGAQMVLVMKLSAFCWNVADGVLPEVELSDFQKDRRLPELPALLDFAGYVFFFPSLMAGPAFDFAEYRRWLDTTMFDVPVTVDPSRKPPTRRKRRIPRSGTPAMVKLLTGALWLVVFLKLSPTFYPEVLSEQRFLEHGFVRRLLIMYMIPLTARTKYYGVWTMTEGACILTGLGYNGIDPATGKVSWDRLRNVSPWEVELAQNTRAYLGGWNINTNSWLRNYVYLRVTPRGKKPGFRATLATFTTSAFWHGFYPGYYMSFVLASLIQTVAKNIRRYCRPFFLDPKTQAPLPSKKYYDVLSWVTTQLTFSFTTTSFLVLSFSGSLQAWARVYFYAVVGTFASMAFFASPAKPHLRRMLEQRAARASVVLLQQPAKSAAAAPAVAKGQKTLAPPTTTADADGMHRTVSSDSLSSAVSREPILGMSSDLQLDFDEALSEIKAEVHARKVKTDALKKAA